MAPRLSHFLPPLPFFSFSPGRGNRNSSECFSFFFFLVGAKSAQRDGEDERPPFPQCRSTRRDEIRRSDPPFLPSLPFSFLFLPWNPSDNVTTKERVEATKDKVADRFFSPPFFLFFLRCGRVSSECVQADHLADFFLSPFSLFLSGSRLALFPLFFPFFSFNLYLVTMKKVLPGKEVHRVGPS